MGVYIKGMKMPETCDKCDFCIWSNYHQTAWCRREQRRCFDDCSVEYREKRAEFCPMSELPAEHGRLIDADALTKMCREMQSIDWNKKAFPYSWEHAYEEFENDIDEAPTIIEAEEGEG